MRLCDTDIERYLDDGIISLTPRPNNEVQLMHHLFLGKMIKLK